MQKIFTLGTDTATVQTDVLYSGSDNLSNADKLIRKLLGLPVTKQLVYYTKNNAVAAVSQFCVKKFLDSWFVIEITLTNGETHTIHSTYLAEMQKPSFITDMEQQAAKIQ